MKSSFLIAESRDGGLLEPDEHRRLQRALRLNLRQAKQLMVPRRRISALDIGTPLSDVIGIVAQSPFSRLPVYRDSIDNVVGMLHTKDLVRWRVGGGPDTTLARLLRPIASVHESVTADRVLRELREQHSHQALVVDEFGGTAGLLTLEDVLSELLGEVGDEFKSEGPVVEALPKGGIPGSWGDGGGRCGGAAEYPVGNRCDHHRRTRDGRPWPPAGSRRPCDRGRLRV